MCELFVFLLYKSQSKILPIVKFRNIVKSILSKKRNLFKNNDMFLLFICVYIIS